MNEVDTTTREAGMKKMKGRKIAHGPRTQHGVTKTTKRRRSKRTREKGWSAGAK